MPTSNWTERTLKGRDLSPRPLRPAEPASFRSDPDDALQDEPTLFADDDADDLMNRPMIEAELAEGEPDAVRRVPITTGEADDLMDRPLIDAAPERGTTASDDLGDRASESAGPLGATRARDEVITPRFEQERTEFRPAHAAAPAKDRSRLLLVAVPVAVVALGAVAWLALSGGGDQTPAAPADPLAIAPAAAPISGAEPLIGMPVTETGLPEGGALPAASAPAARAETSAPSRARPDSAAPEPGRAEPAPIVAESAPSTPVADPVEPAPPTAEADQPLIETEPLVIP